MVHTRTRVIELDRHAATGGPDAAHAGGGVKTLTAIGRIGTGEKRKIVGFAVEVGVTIAIGSGEAPGALPVGVGDAKE